MSDSDSIFFTPLKNFTVYLIHFYKVCFSDNNITELNWLKVWDLRIRNCFLNICNNTLLKDSSQIDIVYYVKFKKHITFSFSHMILIQKYLNHILYIFNNVLNILKKKLNYVCLLSGAVNIFTIWLLITHNIASM